MPILNYTTSIDSEKSISEIRKTLVRIGATKIVTDYESGLPSSLTFCINANGKMIAFNLPSRKDGILAAMKKDKKIPRSKCTEAQAQRVAWRILKDWIKAQAAIIEAELAESQEVFLPYAVTKYGGTVYEDFKSGMNNLLLAQ